MGCLAGYSGNRKRKNYGDKLLLRSREEKIKRMIQEIPMGTVFYAGYIIEKFKRQGFRKFVPESNRVTLCLNDCSHVEKLENKLWKKIA